MTFLEVWVQSEWAKTMGATLLHSLWEGAVVALTLALVLSIAQSSRIRYAAGCLAMAIVLLGCGVTLYRLMPGHNEGRTNLRIHAAMSPAPEEGPQATIHAWEVADLLPWLAPLWLAGVALFQLRCLASWMAAGRLRRIGVCEAPHAWVEKVDIFRTRLRMTRPVTILESCLADVPAVIGHLRPIILMPVGLLAGLPAGQAEAILLHELAHIRRADYVVNLMQTMVEGLLFYHPAVWWISTVIRAERENCCDDLVIATNGNAHVYASALTALAGNRLAMQDAMLAATGGNLVKRIRRILTQPEGSRTAWTPIMSTGILIATCGVAFATWQSPQPSLPSIPSAPAAEQREAVAARIPFSQMGASPSPLKETKGRKKALEQMHETLSAVEGSRPYSMLLAQKLGNASAVEDQYEKWLAEVSYIITTEERKAFQGLRTDTDRDLFIKQFWQRRDPTAEKGAEQYPTIPRGNADNDFKKDFYRRIEYANGRFGTKTVAGWKTDRGRIYVTYGPPDEIDSHPAGGVYTWPPEEGGGQTTTHPFEQWRYRFIEGIGKNIIIEFVDQTRSGDYRMTTDPSAKDALYVPKAGSSVFRLLGASPEGIVEITADRKMVVTIPIDNNTTQISTIVTSPDGKTLIKEGKALTDPCEGSGCRSNYVRTFPLTIPSGTYVLTVEVRSRTMTQKTYVVNFAVN